MKRTILALAFEFCLFGQTDTGVSLLAGIKWYDGPRFGAREQAAVVGVLNNPSECQLSAVVFKADLFSKDGLVLGEATAVVASLGPGARWAVSAPIHDDFSQPAFKASTGWVQFIQSCPGEAPLRMRLTFSPVASVWAPWVKASLRHD
jgi:hypothetical protein